MEQTEYTIRNIEHPRLVIVGTTGSGKTTLARRLAGVLGLPHVELDVLHWGPDWQPNPAAQFERAVAAVVTGERWIVDGNYSRVRELIWSRATHVIWLNYSFPRVMGQLLLRTLRRALRREELFSGNRESLVKSFMTRDSILLWALRTYHRRRRDYRAMIGSGRYAHIAFIELRGPGEVEGFVQRLEEVG